MPGRTSRTSGHTTGVEAARIARDARALSKLWAEWQAKNSVWAANPMLQAQTALMEVCLKALPGIVRGKQRATDVMFPDSSIAIFPYEPPPKM